MKDLTKYIIAANHSTEKWLIKNHIELYDEIIEYCKDINDITYKEKLWHYQNQIPTLVVCANNSCNNPVKFKGRWTAGYYTYCCQKCSITEVERKKAELKYSRVSKITKEEKSLILQNKEEYKNKVKINKIIKQQELNKKKEYFKNISIENYIQLIKNPNGLYVRDYYVKEHMPHIFEIINNYNNVECEYDEKVYMFLNNLKDRPRCKCSNILKYKNKTIGYSKYCSIRCGAIYEKENATNTMLLNTGFTHHSMLEHNIIKRTKRKINVIKEYLKNDNIIITYDRECEIFKYKCDICDEIHETSNSVISQRIQLGLNPRDCITKSTSGPSNPEIEIREYIESIYSGIVEKSNTKILNRKEIDIYIPDLKIGIEHNGIYWHSDVFKDMDYHHNKWKLANQKDVKLIQIYEDDWYFKQEIVKSRLKNLIIKSENKIYARKCILKQVKFSDVKIFLNTNHLQGSINSSINYGLYYNDELISIMTFGKPRKGIKYKTENAYELYRFCTKLDYIVIGGASKLFNHFIKTHKDVNEVYSFSALEWPGTVYEKIGMTLKTISNYSYWYIEKGLRFSRHKYNRQNLLSMGCDPNKSTTQILKEMKIGRIFGPGNKTYVWKRN